MNLPDDVLIKIYYFKHQLDFKDVMKELIKITIRCFFNISAGLENMCYLSKENNILYKCINMHTYIHLCICSFVTRASRSPCACPRDR